MPQLDLLQRQNANLENHIGLISDLDVIEPLHLFKNELLQVLINIINNAINALKENEVDEPNYHDLS